MALVITNGEYYVVPNKKGGINKTNDITEAQVFSNVNTAAEKLKETQRILKGILCLGYRRRNNAAKTNQNKKKTFFARSKKVTLSAGRRKMCFMW